MMEKILNKLAWYSLLTLIMVVVIGVGIYTKGDVQPPTLGGGTFNDPVNLLNAASTSPTFLISGATSTVSILTKEARSIDLNLQFNASTTASNLIWITEFSDDGIDWFMEDVAGVAGSVISHNATATSTAFTYHSWTPASVGTSRKNVTITPIASNYMRLQFASWGGNGSLWGQAILNRVY